MTLTKTMRGSLAALIALALTGCTTTQEAFDKNPKQVPKVDICRTLIQQINVNPAFAKDLVTELVRRGVNPYECPAMVQKQDQAAAALVAVAVVGGAVAYCSNHSCGGGGYAPAPRYPGNCYSYYDRAADGSLCGNRSATSRPGGW